jgi:hypothetical protein
MALCRRVLADVDTDEPPEKKSVLHTVALLDYELARIEPLGFEANKSCRLHALPPTNVPYGWESKDLNHRFLHRWTSICLRVHFSCSKFLSPC